MFHVEREICIFVDFVSRTHGNTLETLASARKRVGERKGGGEGDAAQYTTSHGKILYEQSVGCATTAIENIRQQNITSSAVGQTYSS